MTPEERKKFLEEHRLCVIGLGRDARAPHLSPVYYVLDGGDLLISTTASRAKAKLIRRGAPVSVCVLGEAMPFPYLTVSGRATIEDDRAVDVMMAVGGKMSGNAIPESARPAVQKRADDEGRVVLRVTPEAYYP